MSAGLAPACGAALASGPHVSVSPAGAVAASKSAVQAI
jgi:hypothetical protein